LLIINDFFPIRYFFDRRLISKWPILVYITKCIVHFLVIIDSQDIYFNSLEYRCLISTL